MTLNFVYSDYVEMCEKIFAYIPGGSKWLIYKGRYWRTSPIETSDDGESWHKPTAEEIASLPKTLRIA